MSEDHALTAVVDDDASVRRSLERLLHSTGLLVESFASAEAFLRRESPHQVTCLILDARLPGMDGLALQRELDRRGFEVPIVFISGHDDPRTREQAIDGGAVDFLAKPFQDVALLAAVQRAIARHRHIRKRKYETAGIVSRWTLLTARERAVFPLLLDGLLDHQIAGQLGVREKTVRSHRARILQKMQVESLPELLCAGEKAGLRRA